MSSTSTGLLERLAPPTPSSARAERGRVWLAAHGLPTSRDEAWHYAPVDVIVRALETATPPADPSPAMTRAAVDDLAGDHGGPRLVFVNGALDLGASDVGSPVDGLWLGNRDGMKARPPSARAAEDQPVDGVHATTWAAGREGAAVMF